jgi:hypothetical protein
MSVAILQHLSFRCFHEFSWPRQSGDGRYYQVCLHCGARYGYDWAAMRRTKRLNNDSETVPTTLSDRPTQRWRPRERRFRFEVQVLYRMHEEGCWQTASTVNISRSGLLVRAAETVENGTPVQFILDMPKEIAGYHQHRVLCKGTVVRTTQGAGSGQPLLAFTITDYEFVNENAIGA